VERCGTAVDEQWGIAAVSQYASALIATCRTRAEDPAHCMAVMSLIADYTLGTVIVLAHFVLVALRGELN